MDLYKYCIPLILIKADDKFRSTVGRLSRLNICFLIFKNSSCNIKTKADAFNVRIVPSTVKTFKKKRVFIWRNCLFAPVTNCKADITDQFCDCNFDLCAGLSIFYRIVQNVKKRFRRPLGIYQRGNLCFTGQRNFHSFPFRFYHYLVNGA